MTLAAASIERNQQGTVFIDVDAMGDENTFGTSITFDPDELTALSVALSSGAPAGASLIVNAAQSGNGHIGIVVSMPIGQTSAAGHLRIIEIKFLAKPEKLTTSTTISFDDQPIARQVVKADATSVPVSSVSFAAGTITFTRSATLVSAASFTQKPLSPSSIASAFALHLATGQATAASVPLPLGLLGTRVRVKDAAGVERLAPLFYVGVSQVNFLIPDETVAGPATVTVVSGDGTLSIGNVQIADVSPSMFTGDSTGAGVVAGDAYRYRNGQFFSQEPLSLWDGTKIVAREIDLGPETDQLFLVLYGTGFRFNGGLSLVQASLGGKSLNVGFAGPQGYFVGEDQINLGPLPRSLAGSKSVNLVINIAGKAANMVTVNIK